MAEFRIVEFETRYRNGKEPVDWVCLAPPGESFLKTQTWHRVSKLKPRENPDPSLADSLTHKFMVHRWEIIEPAYKAWKEGEALPEHGTPLAAWGGVTKEMARALKSMGLHTVEDVRDNPESVAKLNFPNARKLSETAGAYLSGADKAAADAENAELKERIAAMEEMLKEAMAKEAPKKRGPGRPRKEDAEAA